MTKANNPVMIKKILKLENFGRFCDFIWPEELNEFKKFNLIYGWNRSGKTTISRVFSSCEKKSNYDKEKFKQCPENGSIKIELTDNSIISSSDITKFPLKVKVFKKYIIKQKLSQK